MKIATFNVNNINRRLPNLLQWLKSARPDIACLRELKSTDANFPITRYRKKPVIARFDAVRKHGTASLFCLGTASRSQRVGPYRAILTIGKVAI